MDVQQYAKDELLDVAEKLTENNIKELIEYLWIKDDKIRYPSFLLLQYRSVKYSDVYPYWDHFMEMLECENSYSRAIGLNLMALNAKWDSGAKFCKNIDRYLAFCEDEKLTTARLCIQSLSDVLKGTQFNRFICDKISERLISIDVYKRPETHWKVMLTDIAQVLIAIQKINPCPKTAYYLHQNLKTADIDKKLKKEIEALPADVL